MELPGEITKEERAQLARELDFNVVPGSGMDTLLAKLLRSYDMRLTACEVLEAEKAMRSIPRHDSAAWDARADKYLEEAMARTPQEVTVEQVAELREAVELAEGVSAVTPFNGPLVAKLLDSYEMMRVEYESAHARCMLAFDDRDEAREQLRAKMDRQVVVLRVENWQGAIGALNRAHQVEDPSVLIDRAIMLLTKVDDGSGRKTEPSYDVPAEVHKRGWQWRPVNEITAFAPPFGTIRVCCCGALVAGGPAFCARCVSPSVDTAAESPNADPHDAERQKRKAQLDALTDVRGLLEHGHARENVRQASVLLDQLVHDLVKELS